MTASNERLAPYKCPYCRKYYSWNVHDFMLHMQECPAVVKENQSEKTWHVAPDDYEETERNNSSNLATEDYVIHPSIVDALGNQAEKWGLYEEESDGGDILSGYPREGVLNEFYRKSLDNIDVRQDKEGNQESSYELIAQYWNIYLDTTLSELDVANMLELFKMARWQMTEKGDHLYDKYKYAEQAYYFGDDNE